ncbi:MAG: translation initiation factor [Myxococcales bacterium]
MADRPFHTPFAALAGQLGRLPEGPQRAESPPPAGPARAVVRMERKGRRGKEVTVIEQLALRPAALEDWLREIKRALGCGGSIEGGAIVLQGDLRERVRPLLEARGVRKISMG